MNTAVATTDYAALLQQRISEKIKSGFIEMVPDAMFDEMVTRAMDELVNGPTKKRFEKRSVYQGGGYVDKLVPIEGYNPLQDITTIPGMIYAELHARAKAAVIATFAKPEYSNTYNPDGLQDTIESGIAKIVTDNADVFMKSLVSGIIRSAMANTIGTLRENNGKLGIY